MPENTNKFRPPIVAVMGHIDHGKTSLLDKIRHATVAAKEAGGITQHINSYQTEVSLKNGKKGKITFIDTPGHAAFCNMRVRGANVTDLVVLVISAVDGVMIQTKECIAEIKKSSLPVIIAMNKIDLDGSSPEKIKGQLVEADLTPEDYGGQVPVIPVSAKTGAGIDELLESILLHAEIMELENHPELPLEASIIESKLDKARGPVASVIVKNGTLHLGDVVYAHDIFCKIKAMLDSSGKPITEAFPSTPVEILGFEKVPAVGSLITPVKFEKVVVEAKKANPANSDLIQLPIVIKADVEGTLEALKNSFSDDVRVISASVGAVTDNDIFLAQAAKAQVFAFNVNVPRFIQNLAENQKVTIIQSKVIYEIIENIQSQVLKMMDPTIEETILGEGTIIAEFKIDKVRIAGIKVTKGEFTKGDLIHLRHDEKITKDTKVDGIHQAKSIVEKVKVGAECGMTFKPYVDFKINDVIISYKK
ncbi:MAG: translation initiation factor IF-2 [Candidatus Shapirobacteria bacterium]|jgi:translation initiation factor IF-2